MSRKNSVAQRLNIIKGQIGGLAQLIENNEDCNKVTDQFYAISSALKKATELYFKENLNSCLKTVSPKKRKTIEYLLEKLIKND